MTSRIYLSPPSVQPLDRTMLLQAFDSGWIAPFGPDLDRFEAEVAETAGMPYAVALSSGTAALHLALVELGVGPGDEVLVSTFTFAATAYAVTYVGAQPVFIDSDPASWNMSADLLAEELSARSARGDLPKAVIVVDLYGQCADYGRITALCEQHEVALIEDAAEAIGATCEGRPAGSFGQFGVFSFNGNKTITTSGGGALLTRDRRAADHVRHLATQARDDAAHYEHSEIGYNYRLSNLLAALGRGQLADLPRRVRRRRALNDRYRTGLAALPVGFLPEAPYGTSTCWLTCITLDPARTATSPEEVRLALEACDIETRPTWKPMHLQPVFSGAPCRVDGTSERLFRTGLCLPSGSSLSDSDQDRVIEAMVAVIGPP